MPKTLTKMQELIVAKTLTITATQFVFLRNGEVNSLNHLRETGLIGADAWGSIQPRHLSKKIKDIFFGENARSFMISNLHGEGWLIFDDGRYLTKVYNEDDAKHVVAALKMMKTTEQKEAA